MISCAKYLAKLTPTMAELSQMALLMADINGAYAQSALSCRTRVETGIGFKCTLPQVPLHLCVLLCVHAVNVRLSMGHNSDYVAQFTTSFWWWSYIDLYEIVGDYAYQKSVILSFMEEKNINLHLYKI